MRNGFKGMRFLLVAAILLLFFPASAKAEYIFNEKIEYHPVDEPDPNKLLFAASKVLKKKCNMPGRLIACISGSVDIKPKYIDIGKGKCGIASLKFTTSAIYHIPEWNQKEQSSPEIQKKWEDKIDDAILHEKHHGEIQDRHMSKAYNEILRLEARCKKMRKSVSKILKRFLDDEARENRRFDARDSGKPTSFPN